MFDYLLEAHRRYFLPRVVCYLDDVSGDIDYAYNDFAGELLAVKEFNESHADIEGVPRSRSPLREGPHSAILARPDLRGASFHPS